MAALFYVLAILLAIVIWGLFAYYRILHYQRLADSKWAEITDLLKERWNRIPDLLRICEARDVSRPILRDVEDARQRSIAAPGPSEIAESEASLSRHLFALFVAAEAIPELTSDSRFQSLQDVLARTEDEIQQTRKYYNAVVHELNEIVTTFPRNLVAILFRMDARDFFLSEEEYRQEMESVIV
jgi:LemA protein